jgi:hypothetical protein
MVPEEKFNSRPKGLEMAESCFQKVPGRDLAQNPEGEVFERVWGRAGESPWEGLGKGLGSLEGFGASFGVLGKVLVFLEGFGDGFRGSGRV